MNGKVALVTGGAAGIGRASAIALSRAGYKLVVADVAVTGGEETTAAIKQAGGDATFVKADVSNAAEVRSLVEKTMQVYGRLDCAHNNAGVEHPLVRTADCAEEDWDRTIKVNLKGVWLCMKYEIPRMLAQGGGAIVNTASVAGLVGGKKLSAYTASKHGVVGLTKAAAIEYASAGIRINVVCPGLIDTEMLERASVDQSDSRLMRRIKKLGARRWLASHQRSRRLGSPQEVADAVVWLCSDAASYVNGHSLVIDGGFIA